MKKSMRKILFCLFETILCCTICIMSANAATTSIAEEHESQILFTNKQRMNSDGSFIFELNYRLTSSRFTATSTTIRIDTCAQILMVDGTGDIFTDASELFRVTLYHDGFFDSAVDSYIGAADNIYGGKTFTNITSGDKYYFIIEPVDENFSMTPKYFTGYGNVSNVIVN